MTHTPRIADFADADVAVPPRVAALAGRAEVVPVWLNQVGGLTFELRDRYSRVFIKWSPLSSGIDLRQEAERLHWLASFPVAVPQVIDAGADDDATWLMTTCLPGENAVAARWKAQPAAAVRAIGEGLRILHDALPVEDCPFSWTVDDRLSRIDGQAPPPDVRTILADPPPIDRVVVCHGDACSPNTLLSHDGRFSGHVDLGSLGIADRWADLAIATWATTWNYGPGWEQPLLDAYGIAPDGERTHYYRLLWEHGP